MRLHVDDLWTPDQPLPTRTVLDAVANRCGEIWQEPDLARRVRIGYNTRLREHPAELVPTLVHELAHVVVYCRYGPVPPHGRHFRVLMSAVGLSGKATHNLPVQHLRRRPQRYLYLHRCDGCGYQFTARRVRRGYYCTACGPGMNWDIVRVPNTEQGRRMLQAVLAGG
jgi:predicted SprT family Zn-dependent metalloprotease